MKVLVQRVSEGAVNVGGQTVGRIGRGYVALVGVRPDDRDEDAVHLARKTAALRIFPDAAGKMNLSIQDIGGAVLAISQFTLYADARKGNRPSFIGAADPALAARIYNRYVSALQDILGAGRVATGRFGADMAVSLVNDGPVTIELSTDSAD